MLEIRLAKEIKGTYALPPNPDLLMLALTASLSDPRPVRMGPLCDTPLVSRIREQFAGVAEIRSEGNEWVVGPPAGERHAYVELDNSDLRFRELIVFSLLAMDITVGMKPLPDAVVQMWQACAQRLGCSIESRLLDDGMRVVSLSPQSVLTIPDGTMPQELLHPCLGLALGAKRSITFDIDYQFSSPLRHLAAGLGYSIQVKSRSENKENELLAKRLRFLGPRRKSEGSISFSVTADFSSQPTGEPRLIIPGDDILGSVLLTAKAFVQKGNLIIENVPLEMWSNATLNLLRKMGCKPAVQESSESSFGKVGMIQPQRFDIQGRKTECSPYFLYAGHLPSMVVVCCFAQGQSVFRGLEQLRYNEPDGIELILECVRALGGRHGEMPDGIVIDGLKQFDGFDLEQELPATLSGACAAAGLKCMGKTTIADTALLARWPDFPSMLESICEYRK